MFTTIEELASVPTPKATKTYTPVSHVDLVNSILEQIDKAGLTVKDSRYSQNRGGKQMFGNLTIGANHTEQDMNLGFRNSYDKTLQIGLVAGSRVIVCSNLMFRGEYKALHMHQGNIAKELDKVAGEAVASLENNFKMILKESDKFKAAKIDKATIAELVGGMFLHEELIRTEQLNIIKNELEMKKLFSDETIWDLYNHTTEALKKSPVNRVINDHLKVHDFFLSKC